MNNQGMETPPAPPLPATEEIEALRSRLEKLELSLQKETAAPEKEKLIKGEIKNYFQQLQQMPKTASPAASRDEAEEIKKFEPGQQLGALISLAFEEGLEKAVAVARDLNNPAILDELHDSLVDHYYDALVKKGILKL